MAPGPFSFTCTTSLPILFLLLAPGIGKKNYIYTYIYIPSLEDGNYYTTWYVQSNIQKEEVLLKEIPVSIGSLLYLYILYR